MMSALERYFYTSTNQNWIVIHGSGVTQVYMYFNKSLMINFIIIITVCVHV